MFRLIVRLDIKGSSLIKSVQFEGLRKMGDPAEFAKRYSDGGADEILFMDTVATLYGRNQLGSLLSRVNSGSGIPITVGGGISRMEDISSAFGIGADKVAINTAAIRQPEFISETSRKYGSQAVVVSIEAKKTPHGWEAYTDNGREKTGKCAIQWAQEAVSRGAGEILMTSIDREGTRSGFDLALLEAISDLPVPIIASGGAGNAAHIVAAMQYVDAVAVADILHYGRTTLKQLKREIQALVPARTDIRHVA